MDKSEDKKSSDKSEENQSSDKSEDKQSSDKPKEDYTRGTGKLISQIAIAEYFMRGSTISQKG